MTKVANRPAGSHGVTQPRGIIDRRELATKIAGIVALRLPAETTRVRVLAALKAAREAGGTEIRRRFEADDDGRACVRAQCYLADQLIRVIYDHARGDLYPLANPSTGEVLSLVALGGYGRGELAPFSDIDLLFLLPYKKTPHSEQVVEATLYLLWDLGYRVGHAVRSVEECLRLAREDLTICTSLLEARWLWGDKGLYRSLRQRFTKEVQGVKDSTRFVEAKLDERSRRHARHGATRYILEPNIKEGKGGLRDLHTLYWIAKYLYRVDDVGELVARGVFTRAEVRRFAKAETYLWTLRCLMHYLTGRPEERLTFDLQQRLAPLLGYTQRGARRDVERLMKHYFLVAKEIGDLTRIFCSALEAAHNRRSRYRLPGLARQRRIEGFRLEGDRLTVEEGARFVEAPIDMLRIFHVAQRHDLDIHPEALRWITRSLKAIGAELREDPEANRILLEMLTARQDPEVTLRRLSEAGVLGRFLPDFGRVVAQMQFNMYHHYTVDEHSIMAVGILHRIEEGVLKDEVPIASEVVHKVLSRRVLYLAVFLHDIAKGRSGDHSELGAKVAEKLAPRLGFSDEETEAVAWLVRHHLAMSATAFKRDLGDPQTIRNFAELVQSPERLRLLLVLTVADIRAVGPGVWNAWKAGLLRDLYWRTEAVLTGGVAEADRAARIAKAQTRLTSRLTDWTAEEQAAHLQRFPDAYWLSVEEEMQLRHALLLRAAAREETPLRVECRIDRYLEATEVTVLAGDDQGLFSRIAGAIAVAGGTIQAARIFTLGDGLALDTFFVRDAAGGPLERPDRLARLSAAIEQALAGRLRIEQELERRRSPLPSRLTVFKVAPRVLIDNKASARATVVEVNGRDRVGLLYELTRSLSALGLAIRGARVMTFGERAVDVFYLQDADGAKIIDESALNRIRDALVAALEGTPGAAEKRTRKRPRPAA